jgi:hypothetical protein
VFESEKNGTGVQAISQCSEWRFLSTSVTLGCIKVRCFRNVQNLLVVTLLVSLSSCASLPQRPLDENSLAYAVFDNSNLLRRHSPVFLVEESEKDHNRIGTPVATISEEEEVVSVDPNRAAFYTSINQFKTAKDSYTNLFYRIHFRGVPFGFFPFYLGAGKNVGLIVVVTLNHLKEPVLYTMVQTCGCYLAFVPTSYLQKEKWKKDWHKGRQNVYTEDLPAYLDYSSEVKDDQVLVVHLRSATHRVKNVWLAAAGELKGIKNVRPELQPFEALERISLSNGETTSFYETTGGRKDYVKGSQKIWERLLISWWSLDWHVGEDKKLGRDLSDGLVFYTSLKPWARGESDLRDFAGFLRYWGWNL